MAGKYQQRKRQPWNGWYKLARWVRLARRQLQIEPLCRLCLADGVITAAQVADHVVPHKGDVRLFWEGALQSLCKSHHDSTKQQIELKGYYDDIGLDGWPTDSRHPVYQGKLHGKAKAKSSAKAKALKSQAS